jgi:hypothetical protein
MLHAALTGAGVASTIHLRDGTGHLIESCPDDTVVDAFVDDVLR